MNGFNLSNISDLYVGSTQALAAYYGSTLIWSAAPHDYLQDYLTIKNISNSNSNINFTSFGRYISYSKDLVTWTRIYVNDYSVNITTLSPGEKVYLKGEYNFYSYKSGNNEYISMFNITEKFNVYGNILSLVYGDNFADKTNLSNAISYNYTFYYLFRDTSVVDASNLILPTNCTTSYCYAYMFADCPYLTGAPELPATTLTTSCYERMFWNCTSLNYIKAMFTTTPGSDYTFEWVKNVASTGTFEKNPNATWQLYGVSGVPIGWEYSDYSMDYFTIESLEDNNEIQFYKRSSSASDKTIQWSTDGTTWSSYTSSTSATTFVTLNTGDKIIIKGTNTQYASDDTNNTSHRMLSTKTINVYGNIMSLIYGDNFVGQTTLTAPYTFRALFWKGNIVDASNLILPATTLAQYCYRSMFDGNASLIATPKVLPAMTLANSCYMNMFIGCSSLTSVPNDMLPATTLAPYCYQGFLANCTQLINSPELPAPSLANYCYQSMYQGCSNLKSITCLATNTSATRAFNYWVYQVGSGGTFTKKSGVSYSTGISGIPSGWTVIDA